MQESSFTYRELLDARSLGGQGAALACCIALFAFIGPFGTYDSIGPLDRVGYWAVTMGANWLVCGGAIVLALHIARAGSRQRRMLAIALAALVAAIPGAGVVFTAEALFRPGYADAGALPTIYLSVAVLMLAIGSLVDRCPRRMARGDQRLGSEDGEKVAAADDDDATADPVACFLGRLPPELGRDLVFLKMADHYVEAFTTAGSTLVLMRFADAVAELEGADGLRVHRSYWVARTHVTGAARRRGRTTLRLTGGHEAPVSRGYLGDVRAAGLV